MTAYVDNARVPLKRGFRTYKMCHLIADTDTELLRLADRIGVDRRWHQFAGTYRSHLDVAASKREEAIRWGAVAVTRRELGRLLIARRRTGTIPRATTITTLGAPRASLACDSCDHLAGEPTRIDPPELGPAFRVPCRFFIAPTYHHPDQDCPGWVQREPM